MRWRVLYTDYGTVILHWVFALLIIALIVTGLRLGADSSDHAWLVKYDSILPQKYVWTLHVPLGFGLFGIAVSYGYYLAAARLFSRIRLDRARIAGLAKAGKPRRSAVNVILYWMLYGAVVVQVVSGIGLYLGFGGYLDDTHWIGAWVIVFYVAAHIVSQFSIGGFSQLVRIVRPGPVAPPAPPFNLYDVLTRHVGEPDLAEAVDLPREERTAADVGQGGEPRAAGIIGSLRSFVFNPLVMAIVVGGIAVGALYSAERMSSDTLVVGYIETAARPVLDGDLAELAWRRARPVVVRTNHGANFDGDGETAIEVKSVHDGQWAYFAFVWADPTRSLKHLPLIKTAQGWRVIQTRYDAADEDAFFEDSFSVLLTQSSGVIAGDRTFHSGRVPLHGKPASPSGRGFHFTTDGSFVDVWHWKATRNGTSGCADNGHFGAPAEPDQDQIDGRKRYQGGYRLDAGEAGYANNFVRRPDEHERSVLPLRLPKNWQQSASALGRIDLDPNHGDTENSRWYLSDSESSPYSSGADAAIPVGAVIPGVIKRDQCANDPAAIVASARWAAGRWTLEMARRLDTQSPFDVAIATDTYMRVAAFDHSQSRHTRSVRPIKLEVETCGKCAECPSTDRSSPLTQAMCFLTQR
jgi:cytochrome b561